MALIYRVYKVEKQKAPNKKRYLDIEETKGGRWLGL
jgi:hypothetical protein